MAPTTRLKVLIPCLGPNEPSQTLRPEIPYTRGAGAAADQSGCNQVHGGFWQKSAAQRPIGTPGAHDMAPTTRLTVLIPCQGPNEPYQTLRPEIPYTRGAGVAADQSGCNQVHGGFWER